MVLLVSWYEQIAGSSLANLLSFTRRIRLHLGSKRYRSPRGYCNFSSAYEGALDYTFRSMPTRCPNSSLLSRNGRLSSSDLDFQALTEVSLQPSNFKRPFRSAARVDKVRSSDRCFNLFIGEFPTVEVLTTVHCPESFKHGMFDRDDGGFYHRPKY